MPNSLIHKTMGGGYRPHPDIIKAKVGEYRRRKHLHPTHLKIDERRVIAHTLSHHFEFTPREIADFLHVDPRTVRNDLSIMQLHVKIYPLVAAKVSDLYNYILYNARYIH